MNHESRPIFLGQLFEANIQINCLRFNRIITNLSDVSNNYPKGAKYVTLAIVHAMLPTSDVLKYALPAW